MCIIDQRIYFIYYNCFLISWTLISNIFSYNTVMANLRFYNFQMNKIYKKIKTNSEFFFKYFAIRDNSYLLINSKIISDKLRSKINLNQDLELISLEYNQIVSSYAILMCFGTLFPLIFILNYFIFASFVFLDRRSIINYHYDNKQMMSDNNKGRTEWDEPRINTNPIRLFLLNDDRIGIIIPKQSITS